MSNDNNYTQFLIDSLEETGSTKDLLNAFLNDNRQYSKWFYALRKSIIILQVLINFEEFQPVYSFLLISNLSILFSICRRSKLRRHLRVWQWKNKLFLSKRPTGVQIFHQFLHRGYLLST